MSAVLRPRRGLHALAADRRGLAATEFALALPVVIGVGAFCIELTNQTLAAERLNLITLAAADNASRLGITAASSSQQLREVDINDVIAAIRLQGAGRLAVTTNGRITISSIRGGAGGAQTMEWQRCIGLKKGTGWDSTYGTMTTTPFTGMGATGQRVQAPTGSSAIFVETNYEYTPLIRWFGGTKRKLSYTASFIVRDNRLAGAPQQSAPAVTVNGCSQWTT